MWLNAVPCKCQASVSELVHSGGKKIKEMILLNPQWAYRSSQSSSLNSQSFRRSLARNPWKLCCGSIKPAPQRLFVGSPCCRAAGEGHVPCCLLDVGSCTANHHLRQQFGLKQLNMLHWGSWILLSRLWRKCVVEANFSSSASFSSPPKTLYCVDSSFFQARSWMYMALGLTPNPKP